MFRGTSPFAIDEYEQYHYPELKDEKPDQAQKDELPVDNNNHCIAEGELVETSNGSIPIEEIKIGHKVLTRNGFRKVLFSAQTDVDREIMQIQASNGNVVNCTPDHLIYTNRGFLRADSVRYGDVLTTLGDISTSLTMKTDDALSAMQYSLSINTQKQRLVQSHVQLIYKGKQRKNVYDLTIENDHEIFACGVLVHNCMDCERYLSMALYKPRGHRRNKVVVHSDNYNVKKERSPHFDNEIEKLKKRRKNYADVPL